MRIDRKLLVPIAMLAVVFAAGAAYAISTFMTTTTVTVNEPLSVTPATTHITTFAGDPAGISYNVIVSNAASFSIAVNFAQAVTSVPAGGSASDVSCTTTFVNGTPVPGGGMVDITVNCMVSPAAVPGDYVITNTVTKA